MCTLNGSADTCVAGSAADTCVAGSASPGETFPPNVGGWTYFRAENDDANRYFWSPDRKTWMVQTHSGITSFFGQPMDKIAAGDGRELADVLFRIQAPSTSIIYRWNLVRQYDTIGNVVVYSWSSAQAAVGDVLGIQYLTDIYDTPPAAGDAVVGSSPPLDSFAHHTHLNWSLPDGLPDGDTASLTQSPIWRAQPALRLLRVDVTSMPMSGKGPRLQVRRYHIDYTLDDTLRRRSLTRFTVEGTCTAGGQEDAQGLLAPKTDCPTLPSSRITYSEIPDLSPLKGTVRGVFGNKATFPTSTSPSASGPLALIDVNGDSLPELVFSYTHDRDSSTHVDMAVLRNPNDFHLSNPTDRQPLDQYIVEDIQSIWPDGKTTVADIAPGAKNLAYGDFDADGTINALTFDNGLDNGGSQIRPSFFRFYSLTPPSSQNKAAWIENKAYGPITPPDFFPHALWTSLDWKGDFSSFDIDGDGLIDALLPERLDPPPNPGNTITHRAYLSARSTEGVVQPFVERTRGSCVPHHVGSTKRVIADFDGDGLADIIELELKDFGGEGVVLYTYKFKNRGDGRFGIGTSTGIDPCRQTAGVEQITAAVDQNHHYLVDPQRDSNRLALHDLNGDKRADLVTVTEDGVFLSLNLGGVFKSPVSVTQGLPWLPKRPGVTFDPKNIQIMFADVDASGVDDLVV
jgi:hypothetical protein